MLIDNHHREINYLRLAVTDRCNLRCTYCMPENGINFAKKNTLLTIDELIRLSNLMIAEGVDKIRITGGEPFVRKDIMQLLRSLRSNKKLKNLSITTNATLIGPYIEELKEIGIDHINVSLDGVDAESFKHITRRNQFETVYENLIKLVEADFDIKINCVVMNGQNTDQIIPMLETLTKHYPISVRFLEEMPFNGKGDSYNSIEWNHKKIFQHISESYSEIEKLYSGPTSTSVNYKIPGHLGTFGIIPSFSRTFCGSCNRLRITATGDIITCLYANAYSNVREMLRNNPNSDQAFINEIKTAISQRAKTGIEAEELNKESLNSMTSIGG